MWFDKYKKYGFIENVDFQAMSVKFYTAQGNESTAKDYQITIEMAKELCMLQRTEKGEYHMKYTKNLNLNKPEEKDNYDVHVLNKNMDTLDAAIEKIMKKEGIKPRKPLFETVLTTLIIMDDQLTKTKQVVKLLREVAQLANSLSDWNKAKS